MLYPTGRDQVQAKDLMRRAAVFHPDDPAEDLVLAFETAGLRAVAVASLDGRLIRMVTDLDLLHALLPPYVQEDPVLARVLEDNAAWALRRRLKGQRVRHVANVRPGSGQAVRPEDTLVEVTSAMVQVGDPAIPVVAGDVVVGVIAVDELLPALLARRE